MNIVEIVYIRTGQIIMAAAAILNNRIVLSAQVTEVGAFASVTKAAEGLATALGAALNSVNYYPASMSKWTWETVLAEIPSAKYIVQSKDMETKPDIVPVAHWDDQVYKPDPCEMEMPFYMELADMRSSHGQLSVTMAPVSGNLDDMLDALFEINTLPGSDTAVQTLHVHFDSDNAAFSLFKKGDSYILRPETGVTLERTNLDGSDSQYWAITSNN